MIWANFFACWVRCSAERTYSPHSCRGIDILFDGTSHRIKKFVLRTNAPGHTEFNSYSKCNFQLDLEPSANGSLSATRPADIRSPIHSESSGDANYRTEGNLMSRQLAFRVIYDNVCRAL